MVCAAAWQAPGTSKDGEGGASLLERMYANSRQGLLGVLFVMTNGEASGKPWQSWFIVILHMLQVSVHLAGVACSACEGGGAGGGVCIVSRGEGPGAASETSVAVGNDCVASASAPKGPHLVPSPRPRPTVSLKLSPTPSCAL